MGSGFFAILDDIAALMDDVAVSSKIASRKTAAILGDDLAVNAEKATGFVSSRELPVLWAITKGSLINKLIIIPLAFALDFFLPAAIKGILVLGGFYLAYEGVEKIVDYCINRLRKKEEASRPVAEADTIEDEKKKIKSAIVTDFILSVEIVVISLGTLLDKEFVIKLLTVCVVALLATVGVYGLVALIIRMDDVGHKLLQRRNKTQFFSILGKLLIQMLPVVIKFLSFAGTIALLMVSGGIFNHNIEFIHGLLPSIPVLIKEVLVAILFGLLVYFLVFVAKRLFILFRGN